MPLSIVGKKPAEQLPLLETLVWEGLFHPVRTGYVKEADLCYQFREGDQYTAAELKILNERNQPDIVYNECEPIIERLVGQYTRQRLAVGIVGRNAPVDDALADTMHSLHRYIDQDSDYFIHEKEAFRDGITGGFGVLECGVESETLGRPRIYVEQQDPFNIAFDPYCRKHDWNNPRGGARYILRFPWITLEEGQHRWPKLANKLADALERYTPFRQFTDTLDPKVQSHASFQIFDRQKRLIRPIEVWFKERREEEVVITPFGVLGDEHDDKLKRRALKLVPNARRATLMRDRLYVAVICGDVVIQPATPSPYNTNLFPFVPYFCHRRKNGQPYGHIKRSIDPNREINARRSRALYMLNARQSIYERNAIIDPNHLAEQLNLADGQIVVEAGKFDKFAVRENQDIGQANLQMLQEAKAELQHLAGEDYLAPSSEMRSGAGVAQQQLPYHLSQVDIFDNLRLTRKMKAQLVTSYVQQFYDEDMVFQVTDDEGKAQQFAVSQSQFQDIKNRMFDFIVKEQPDYATLNDEAAANLQTTLPQVAQYGPAWGKILVMSSQLRDKDKILKMLDEMDQQAPPPPKVSVSINFHELDPQEKASIAMQMGLPDLAQYEAKQGRRPMRDDKAEVDLLKTQIKEGVRSGIENSKLQLQEQQSLMDGQLRLREMDQAREDMLNQQTMGVDSATGTRSGSETESSYGTD